MLEINFMGIHPRPHRRAFVARRRNIALSVLRGKAKQPLGGNGRPSGPGAGRRGEGAGPPPGHAQSQAGGASPPRSPRVNLPPPGRYPVPRHPAVCSHKDPVAGYFTARGLGRALAAGGHRSLRLWPRMSTNHVPEQEGILFRVSFPSHAK